MKQNSQLKMQRHSVDLSGERLVVTNGFEASTSWPGTLGASWTLNAERGFELRTGAASDITSIWEFIAKDNPLAAKRVREDILDAVRRLVPFPIKATNAAQTANYFLGSVLEFSSG
jgi:hypothetical protein